MTSNLSFNNCYICHQPLHDFLVDPESQQMRFSTPPSPGLSVPLMAPRYNGDNPTVRLTLIDQTIVLVHRKCCPSVANSDSKMEALEGKVQAHIDSEQRGATCRCCAFYVIICVVGIVLSTTYGPGMLLQTKWS